MISKSEWTIWTRQRDGDEREFGLLRRMVNGYEGVKAKWTGSDEYAAIFSKAQIEKGEFDTIFMDIDAHNGEDWQEKVRQVLVKCTMLPSRMYITGRGAHLYWDLEEPIVGAGRYKQAVTALVKKWGIGDLVDQKVVGDVRRVARLPMSKNSKGGHAIRVPTQGWDMVIATTPLIGDEETLTNEIPVKIQLVLGESQEAEKVFAPQADVQHVFEESEYPPCIRIGIRQMMETGELDHAERLAVFSFLVMNGEKQKGWELLKNYAGDFNPAISEYQLNYLERTKHKVQKCSNMPRDLCPYSNQRECHFWPSINVFRDKRLQGAK